MNIYEQLNLAEIVLGLEEGTELSLVEEALFEESEVSLDIFSKIAGELVKLTPRVRTAITNTLVTGFIKDDVFIVKENV